MKLKRLAQSTILLSAGDGSTLLVDPGGYNLQAGRFTLKSFPTAEVVVITHKHPDHFNLELLKAMLERGDPILITNPEVHEILQGEAIASQVIRPGERLTAGGFALRAVEADHVFDGERVINFGLVVAADGVSLYHPSDTRYMDPARLPEETRADCLLVPISNRGLVMGIDDALYFSSQLQPDLVIPIHYDSPRDRDRVDPEEFRDKAHRMGLRVRVLGFGETIEL